MTPDLKTPLLWALGLCLVAALVGLGAQYVRMASLRVVLADEIAARAKENEARATAGNNDAVHVAGAQVTHATDQQEIVHELTKAKGALASVGERNRALTVRLRDTSAALTAARDRIEAAGDAAACRDQGDRPSAILDLLEEAGRLSAISGELAVEGRSIIERRDAEVRALKALVQADRELMARAAGVGLIVVPGSRLPPAEK